MPKLLLVGCGKMGGALLHSIAAARLMSEIVVVEPTSPPITAEGVTWKKSRDEIGAGFVPDVVLIAVKPQVIPALLPPYGIYKKSVFLSIAAGVTLVSLAKLLSNMDAAIVRSMPNWPASVGQGVTVAVANTHVTLAQRDLCDRLLRAVGTTAWADDEALLEGVTALSGSGPAYVFALCEAMAKAGETLGLSGEMAAQLARQTIIGSGALLAGSDQSAGDLRRAVTSPKGTTEAALAKLLASPGLNELVQDAMAAAAQRAKELAQ